MSFYDVPHEVIEESRPKSYRLELLKHVIYDTPTPKMGFADFFVRTIDKTRRCGDWIIKVFLEDNMNPNVTDFQGNTPLYFAVASTNNYSTERTLRMLLEHGADINGCQRTGSYLTDTIFFGAIHSRSGNLKNPCCMMLEAGADVENDRCALLTWGNMCLLSRAVIEFTQVLNMLIEAI